MNDYLLPLAPELVLIVGATLLLLVAASRSARKVEIATGGSVLLLLIAGLTLAGPTATLGEALGGLHRADPFAAFAKIGIYIAAAVSILIAPRFFRRGGGEMLAEYPLLIVFSAVGMGMMVSAGDLLTLYVGLELQSLSGYVLASFLRRDTRSAEAGLKYFVLGALASGILLYGVSLLYGFTGTTLFSGIADAFAQAASTGGASLGQLFGLVFVLAGILFKISAVPFHMWTPDVYEGAPTPVTAFFASAPKLAAMALFVRVTVEAMGPATDQWRQIVIFAALASIVLGAVAAIGQSNIKRLLAYSSINNVGFALLGLAAGTAEGVAATLSYMAIYIVMTLGSFLVVLQMRDGEGRPVESIASLAGLSRTRPGLAAAMMIFMLSLAGIPPLFGFWGKFLVFDALIATDYWVLAAIGIALSVIGAYYYLKIVRTMYFDDPAPAYASSDSRIEGGLIAASAVLLSPLGYFLIPALGLASAGAAAALF